MEAKSRCCTNFVFDCLHVVARDVENRILGRQIVKRRFEDECGHVENGREIQHGGCRTRRAGICEKCKSLMRRDRAIEVVVICQLVPHKYKLICSSQHSTASSLMPVIPTCSTCIMYVLQFANQTFFMYYVMLQ